MVVYLQQLYLILLLNLCVNGTFLGLLKLYSLFSFLVIFSLVQTLNYYPNYIQHIIKADGVREGDGCNEQWTVPYVDCRPLCYKPCRIAYLAIYCSFVWAGKCASNRSHLLIKANPPLKLTILFDTCLSTGSHSHVMSLV